jgi:hypothetical protein
MTGLKDLNIPAFQVEASRLRRQGHTVNNPADYPGQDLAYTECMRKALELLVESEVIVMLPGWEKSPGACFEYLAALMMGMKAYNPDMIYEVEPDLTTITTACSNIVVKIWHVILKKE